MCKKFNSPSDKLQKKIGLSKKPKKLSVNQKKTNSDGGVVIPSLFQNSPKIDKKKRDFIQAKPKESLKERILKAALNKRSQLGKSKSKSLKKKSRQISKKILSLKKFILLHKPRKYQLKKRPRLKMKNNENNENKGSEPRTPVWLNLTVGFNNTFATVSAGSLSKVKKVLSLGLLKLNSSKKTYRFLHKQISTEVVNYIRYEKTIRKPIDLFLRIKAPVRNIFGLASYIRTKIKQNRVNSRNKVVWFNYPILKPFNGCRGVKPRRKKRKGLLIFK